MHRWSPMSVTTSAAPPEVDWTVSVTEPLPDCPSIAAAWERIATQTTWGPWRSESKMRGPDVNHRGRLPCYGTPPGGRPVRREGEQGPDDPLPGARVLR